jgi:hypothetical protein
LMKSGENMAYEDESPTLGSQGEGAWPAPKPEELTCAQIRHFRFWILFQKEFLVETAKSPRTRCSVLRLTGWTFCSSWTFSNRSPVLFYPNLTYKSSWRLDKFGSRPQDFVSLKYFMKSRPINFNEFLFWLVRCSHMINDSSVEVRWPTPTVRGGWRDSSLLGNGDSKKFL